MLYYPWRHEETDLLSTFRTYEQHYMTVQSIITRNEDKYTFKEYEDIEIEGENATQLLGNIDESVDNDDNIELITTVEQEDIDHNNTLLTGTPNRALILHQIFTTAAHREYMPADEYRELFKKLNSEQKAFMKFH